MAFDFDVVGKTFGPVELAYDWKRVALYALACGATREELDLLLETRGPKVLPTFSVVPALGPLLSNLRKLGGNMLTLVHGSQRCVLHRPIPAEGKLATTSICKAIYDKGKGALAMLETKTTDASGAPLFDTGASSTAARVSSAASAAPRPRPTSPPRGRPPASPSSRPPRPRRPSSTGSPPMI